MGIEDAFDERPGEFRNSAQMALRIGYLYDIIQTSLI